MISNIILCVGKLLSDYEHIFHDTVIFKSYRLKLDKDKKVGPIDLPAHSAPVC